MDVQLTLSRADGGRKTHSCHCHCTAGRRLAAVLSRALRAASPYCALIQGVSQAAVRRQDSACCRNGRKLHRRPLLDWLHTVYPLVEDPCRLQQRAGPPPPPLSSRLSRPGPHQASSRPPGRGECRDGMSRRQVLWQRGLLSAATPPGGNSRSPAALPPAGRQRRCSFCCW